MDFTFVWIRHFSGSVVPVVPLAVGPLGYLRVVPFGGALGCQDVSLRGRPRVLYDGLLAPLVSSVECLMDGWMDGLSTFKFISIKLWV